MSDQLWQSVGRHCLPVLASRIKDLRRWLDRISSKNPHAAVLSDKTGVETSLADARSAEALEIEVIRQVGLKQLSKREAADWLRLLYLAEERWNATNANQIAHTRLARLPAAQPSPFKKDNISHLPRVEAWRQALQTALRTDAITSSAQLLKAATLLSALLFGALIDSKKLCFLGKFAGQPTSQAGGYRYLEFNLPYAGMGNHHTQRWYPDPMTSLLLWHPAARSAEKMARLPMADIKSVLLAGRLNKSALPQGTKDLLDAATAWWQLKMAPIDIHGLQRSFLVHSIHPRTWRRLHAPGNNQTDISAAPAAEPPDEGSAEKDDLFVIYPWLQALDTLFQSKSKTAALGKLPASATEGTTSHLLQAWLHYAISGNSSTKKARSLKTLAKECIPACTQLLASLGDTSPLQATPPDATTLAVLMDAYREILGEIPQSSQRKSLAIGLREFHNFLVKRHHVEPVPSLEAAFGKDAGLLPVDGNLITFDDYDAVQAWLATPRLNGKVQAVIQVAQLVLMFAFRLGMRRQEIWGLLLDDVDVDGEISIIVRPNATRRLKTPSSKRVIPAEAFLSEAELVKLRAWVATRADPFKTSKDHDALSEAPLFPAQIDGHPISIESIINLICKALRTVTGDQHLYLHHLRHAFGTWTYLRLRAPDHPRVCEFFSGYPLTLAALEQGSELRRRLIGTDVSPSRKYAYAVARLLGHSSPAVSMAHYLHGDDLIWASIVQQEALSLKLETFLSISSIPRSTAFSWPKNSSGRKHAFLQELVEHAYNEACPTQVAPAKRGRPRKEANSPIAQSVSFEQLFIAYQQIAQGELSLERIAKQVKLDIGVLQRIGAGLEAIPGRKKDGAPSVYRLRPRKLLIPPEALFNALLRLHAEDADLFDRGTRIFLENYNAQHCDVVFRGEKTAQDLHTYLNFLKTISLTGKSVRFIHRVTPSLSAETRWAAKLVTKFNPAASIKAVAPPNKAKARSYAKWLGVQLIDEAEKAIGLDYWMVVWLAQTVTKQ